MSNKILLGEDATTLISRVLETVRTAVGSTLGPDGQLALIGAGQSTWTTKDGVTVAKGLKFETDEEEIINRIISEPAIKTDDECGDGTTTTILLTAAIYNLLLKDNSFRNRKRIERVVTQLLETLKRQTFFVNVEDELLHLLALTTANQDQVLAQKVVDIYRSCEQGYPDVEIQYGRSGEDLVNRVEGRVINMSIADPWFAGDNNGNEIKLDRYIPVVVDDRILQANPQDFLDGFLSIRDQVPAETNELGQQVFTPILMVVRSLEKPVINIISNLITQHPELKLHNKGMQPGVIVMATNLGGGLGAAEMQDICSILNAPYVNGVEGLPSAQVKVCTTPLSLGHARSSILDLKEEDVERINTRIHSIETEIATYSYAERFTTRARINERRIRRLRGEVVTILVGGETNQEIKERKDRYEDVVKAVRSALENGILPGCGLGLINAGKELWKTSTLDGEVILNELCGTIYMHLMRKHLVQGDEPFNLNSRHPVINIATGETMDPETMQVWDTAFATITALKGGFQTAQILATASSVFVTNKLHSRVTQIGS